MSTKIPRASVAGGLPPSQMLRRTAGYVLVLALLQPLLAAQQPSQTPSFRTSTLLVVQNVIVRDKKGTPIDGLTAKDFVITEDGVPQQIAFVEYQKLDAPPIGATDITPTVPARPATALPSVTAVGETLNAV